MRLPAAHLSEIWSFLCCFWVSSSTMMMLSCNFTCEYIWRFHHLVGCDLGHWSDVIISHVIRMNFFVELMVYVRFLFVIILSFLSITNQLINRATPWSGLLSRVQQSNLATLSNVVLFDRKQKWVIINTLGLFELQFLKRRIWI